jgi:phosphate starvation-inducible PhoH-like protein
VYDKEKVDMYFERGQIEIVPFAFMRGRNFSNAFIIVDEAQNVTDAQMEMVISRLCKGSKMVIVGDTSQIDLKSKKDSGMYFLSKQVAITVPGVAAISLKTNHRHPIVESVLNMYKELRDL